MSKPLAREEFVDEEDKDPLWDKEVIFSKGPKLLVELVFMGEWESDMSFFIEVSFWFSFVVLLLVREEEGTTLFWEKEEAGKIDLDWLLLKHRKQILCFFPSSKVIDWEVHREHKHEPQHRQWCFV